MVQDAHHCAFPFLLRWRLLWGLLFWSPIHAEDKFAEEKLPPPAPESLERNTTTGRDFEKLVKAALEAKGFQVAEQVQVGTRPNGRRHMIDLVARKDGRSLLISLKWQQTGGTAEQKIPYELICLSEALKQSRGAHSAAYLVLGGEGWTLKTFYLTGGLDRHLRLDQPFEVLSLTDLLARAQSGHL